MPALIAFEQNGTPIHPMNGAPLHLVIPSWPGSCSHKWLTRIWIRDQVHDGPKMTGKSYRVPEYPVEPGGEVPKDALRNLILDYLPTHFCSG
jgi:DMSO/TMAO reductase YedYZ molybdopterin-dependent catalytic subunit